MTCTKAGRTFIVTPADRHEFDSLAAALEHDLKPAGPLETEMFGEILHAAWTQRRIDQAEAAHAAGGLDPLLDKEALKQLSVYSLLRSRAHRAHDRAMKHLRELQEERIFRAERGPEAVPENEPMLPRFAVMRRKVAADERTRYKQDWAATLASLDLPKRAHRTRE